MRRVFCGFLMALSTYSVIPVPVLRIWDDGARGLMTLFLPAVGLVTGLIWFGLASLLRLVGSPPLIMAAALAVYPHVISGFFHLDGFMDCSDAVLSRRDLEERRRILKDSHVGAFAVIALAFLLLATFAFWAELPQGAGLTALIFIPVCARAVAALAVSVLRPLSTSQYSGAYRDCVKKGDAAVLICELAAALILAAVFGGARALAVASASAVFCAASIFFNRRSLGGMSGDIAGCGITTGEAVASAALVIAALLC